MKTITSLKGNHIYVLLLILTHMCNILLIRALFSSGQDSIITAHIKGSFTLKERGVEYKIDIAVRWVLSKFNVFFTLRGGKDEMNLNE